MSGTGRVVSASTSANKKPAGLPERTETTARYLAKSRNRGSFVDSLFSVPWVLLDSVKLFKGFVAVISVPFSRWLLHDVVVALRAVLSFFFLLF